MHPIQKHLFNTRFKDVKGSSIEGTIVLSDELINLGILELLAQLKGAGAPTAESASNPSAGSAMPSPKDLLEVVNVEKLTYRTEKGRALIDIKASI